MKITTQKQIREQFRVEYPNLNYKKPYCTDTRCSFVEYIDHLARDGVITEKLAAKVTL